MIKLLILLMLLVILFPQPPSGKSGKRFQVVENKTKNPNLNSQGQSGKRVISHPFASTSSAFSATAQRKKIVLEVAESKRKSERLTPFFRFFRFFRFLPIPSPAHSPSLRAFTNGGGACALRRYPPEFPLRARLLPLPFVDAVLFSSPTTKQLSEREREGGREDA